jgi:hypothetical protein
MNWLRKISLLPVFLILFVWVLPIVAHAVPVGCTCCAKAECCCGCTKHKPLQADKNFSKKSNCNCAISSNKENDDPIILSSKIVNDRVIPLIENTLEETKSTNDITFITVKQNNYHPKILSLYLLKSSFLL